MDVEMELERARRRAEARATRRFRSAAWWLDAENYVDAVKAGRQASAPKLFVDFGNEIQSAFTAFGEAIRPLVKSIEHLLR